MTQKQKKQSASPALKLAFFFYVPLLGFFVYASVFNQDFFIYIAAGLLACIVVLFPVRTQLLKKEADAELNTFNLQEQTNLIEAEIAKEQGVIASLRKKIVDFSQLKGMTEHLSMCLTQEDTVKTLSEEVNKLFGTEETTIILYLFHSKTGELGISSSHKGQMRVNLKSKKGDVFDRWVVKTMQPLLIEDAKSDYRFDVDRINPEDIRSIRALMSAPLMVENKALGILRVDAPRENYFTTDDLRFLQTIADVGALTVENAQLYERVEQLAIRDGLTQLYLRRYLLERLQEEFGRQMRRKGELSFMLIDIDHFKQYNDTFGHVAGDIVLKTIGKLLSEFFNGPGHLVCRYGGEEFCVLLPDVSHKKAVELAEELRQTIGKTTILLRREETRVNVSIGVSSFPKNAKTKEELIEKADQALYKAKKEGRDRVCTV